MADLLMSRSAIISECGKYRYRLERELGRDGPGAMVIGVNPSTADAEVDDATIRKVMGFGNRLGWGRIIMANKFAYRATDVNALKHVSDPVGPDGHKHLELIMRDADVVVAAWGPLGKLPKHLRRRWEYVAQWADRLEKPLMCWGTSQDGQPRHPLMLAYATELVPWVRPS